MNFQLPSPPKVRQEIPICSSMGSLSFESKESIPQSSISSKRTQFVPIISPRQIPVTCISVSSSGLPEMSSLVKTEPSDSSVFKSSSSIDLEGEMVDNAIDNVISLPCAFSEVVECQKDQSNEIQRQQEMLNTLKDKLVEVTGKKEELALDVTGVTHKIYIIAENKRTALKKCQEYDTEIRQKVTECEKQRNEVKDLEEEIERNKMLFLKYENVISSHKKEVSEFEAGLDLFRELVEMKNEITELKANFDCKDEETEYIVSGKSENELKSRINSREDSIKKLIVNIQDIEENIEKERKRQGQIQVSLNVLQKKNTAQLTRLKKQVKVAQQSNRQWHVQIPQLEKSIEELKYKLGQ